MYQKVPTKLFILKILMHAKRVKALKKNMLNKRCFTCCEKAIIPNCPLWLRPATHSNPHNHTDGKPKVHVQLCSSRAMPVPISNPYMCSVPCWQLGARAMPQQFKGKNYWSRSMHSHGCTRDQFFPIPREFYTNIDQTYICLPFNAKWNK